MGFWNSIDVLNVRPEENGFSNSLTEHFPSIFSTFCVSDMPWKAQIKNAEPYWTVKRATLQTGYRFLQKNGLHAIA